MFSRKSLAEHLDADYIFEKTKQGFEYFEAKFDVPYPFEKYDQMFVPEYNAGAMENAGAVTFTEFYVFRSKVTDAVRERRVVTILHELAHMWFGDLVTMKWWNDLWLNESFAEWASTIATAEATEWTEAWTTFNSMEKSWAYRQDQLPSTHPVVATINDLEDVLVNFDGITYAKGGSVLKQLVAWVGVDAFFQGVSAYFKKHSWGNTTLADLLAELETASGRDLSAWSGLWLETAGVNTLRPEIETDDSGAITTFAVLQSATDEHPTIRPHRLAIGFYNLSGGKLVRDHRVELDVDGERTEVAELVGHRAPRPGAAQRRRPRLREDPPRRAVARRRTGQPVGDREPARPGPRLELGVGRDARCRDPRARLPGPRARQHREPRRSRRRCASCSRTPCSRRARTPRPSGAPRSAVCSPTASGGWRRRRSRAAMRSSSS